MKHKLKYCGLSLLTAAAAMFVAVTVPAQQITGTPGLPSTTETVRGNQLPAPALPFGGVIDETDPPHRAMGMASVWSNRPVGLTRPG